MSFWLLVTSTFYLIHPTRLLTLPAKSSSPTPNPDPQLLAPAHLPLRPFRRGPRVRRLRQLADYRAKLGGCPIGNEVLV